MESDGEEESSDRQEQGRVDYSGHFAPAGTVPVKHIGGKQPINRVQVSQKVSATRLTTSNDMESMCKVDLVTQ